MRSRILLVVGIGVLLAAVLEAPVGFEARWWNVAQNAGHGIVFAAVAVMSFMAIRNHCSGSRFLAAQYAAAFAIAVAAGGLTEILQLPLGRDASWEDFRNDILGACMGLAVLAVLDAGLLGRRRVLACFVAVVPFAILVLPVAECSTAYAASRSSRSSPITEASSIPTSFGAQWAELRHELMPARWSAMAGEGAMLVRLGEGPWPGVEILEPAPNWEGYDSLLLDITNPVDAPLALNLRIHDTRHDQRYADRFNTVLQLPAAERAVVRVRLANVREGPRDRALDLSEIAGLVLFVSGERRDLPDGLLVSRIWLE